MNPASPRTERLRSAAAVVLAASCVAAAALPQGAVDRGAFEFAFSLDLTEDLYHRIAAGLLLPDREPLILEARTRSSDGQDIPARGTYLRFELEQAVLDVRADARGHVVVHMDSGTLLSHPVVWMPATLSSMSRSFVDYPKHPIR